MKIRPWIRMIVYIIRDFELSAGKEGDKAELDKEISVRFAVSNEMHRRLF